MTGPATPARRLGPYTLEGELGAGGMGVVYRARGPAGTAVALKVIRGSLTTREAIRRFEREARVRVEHENVVTVLDAGRDDDGTAYIAFELLEGQTLAERLLTGTLALGEVVDVGTQVAAGLTAAHARGVVHRDLKPSNIFCCADGAVKILDFGVARLGSAETQLTEAGRVVGTLEYLSPEQAEGRADVDAQTDLWSLGAVLYEALTGRPPFRQDTPLATVVATLLSDFQPLVVLRPDIPAVLEAVVGRALEKDRRRRWGDAQAFLEALRETHEQLGTATVRTHPPPMPEGERRVVAVLFARGVRDEGALFRAVGDEGGHCVQLAGNRLIGVFGSETSTGDEMQRAAAAALRARGAAERIALGSGRVSRARTEISGPAIEAAESASEVELEGIGVPAEAARGLPSGLRLTPIGETPIGETLFELQNDPSALEALERIEPLGPLLGREAEQQILRRGIDAIEEERAAVFLLTGPQGIGKSRLIAELPTWFEDGPTLLGARAAPRRGARSLALFRSLLRELIGDRERGLESVVHDAIGESAGAERLRRDLALVLDPPSSSDARLSLAATDLRATDDRLRVALGTLFEALCRRGPVVLALEDLQWCDDGSLELLESIVERCFDAPLVVVATARPALLSRRPDFLDGSELTRIELRGLTRGQVGELAALVAGRELPEPLVRAIADRTGGNPFFVRQIVDALDHDTDIEAELPLPLTVEAAVQARLDQLGVGEKELVKRASVYRRAFRTEELKALDVPEPSGLVRSLRRNDILAARGGGALEFRSPLVAEVAYRMLADDVRTELHRKAAEHLRAVPDFDPEEVAVHLSSALDREDAAQLFAHAAFAAVRRGDAATVLRTAQAALRHDVSKDLRCALHLARADALRFEGRRAEQAQELTAALDSAADDAERARVQSERCVLASRSGNPEEAIERGRGAVAAARSSGDDEVLVLALGRLALAQVPLGEFEAARAALDEAETLVNERQTVLRSLLSEWRGQLAAATGDLGTRRAAFARAAELHEHNGDLRRAAGARCNVADVYNRVGAYEAAVEALASAHAMCTEVGHRTMAGYAQANLGYALAMLGRGEEALEAIEDAKRCAEAIGEARLAMLARSYEIRALLRSDRRDEAISLAATTAAEADRLGMPSIAVVTRTLAARAALDNDDVASAVRSSRKAYEQCLASGGIEEDEIEVYLTYADAVLAEGSTDLAAEVLRTARVRLSELASQVVDEELRRHLLEDVPAHRELESRT